MIISTKFGTVVDLTCVMTYANCGWYRLKGGHFAAVQNSPFSHDFNGWPYNRQAITCCRDDLGSAQTQPLSLESETKEKLMTIMIRYTMILRTMSAVYNNNDVIC